MIDNMIQYVPLGATECLQDGSTACIWRHPTRTGVVLKSPRTEPQDPSQLHKFCTEVGILKALDRHPRIVQYLGPLDITEPAKDLLFIEAVNGDMQRYLDAHGESISVLLRLKWCVQASAALAYCHARGVFHCDLRPENMLLDDKLDLSFCDFGDSKNADFDGDGLPDFGFFDPRVDSLDVTARTEIFGLGSSMYTILVGHLPHGPLILKTAEERSDYADIFNRLALKGNFPDTSKILAGDIIQDCWKYEVRSAEEAHQRLVKLDRQIQHQIDEG